MIIDGDGVEESIGGDGGWNGRWRSKGRVSLEGTARWRESLVRICAR
jgi:hypothetical protein